MTRSEVTTPGLIVQPRIEAELTRLRHENRELKQHIIALTEIALRRVAKDTEH